MSNSLSIGLVGLLAGLAGVLVGAAIVWRLATRHTHSLLKQHGDALASAHRATLEMLAQCQAQHQRGLVARLATQEAALDEFLKTRSEASCRDSVPAVSTPAMPLAPSRPSTSSTPSGHSTPSVRQVEPSRKPIPRPEPVEVEAAPLADPLAELSDAEIDALPPDLPPPLPPRRRVLPSPKSPVMRRL